MGNLITKKGKKKESSAPVLAVKEAVVKILTAEYLALGDTVTKNDGSKFTVERPHFSCEMELVDAGKYKKGDVGTTWFEKFYFPETEEGSGEYENRPGTKLGGLSEARHGPGFWEDENMVLRAEDLPNFTFLCSLEPKTEFGGTKVTGTHIMHKSIEPLPQEEELSEEDVADIEGSLGKSKKG
jgi:hypothetical protein